MFPDHIEKMLTEMARQPELFRKLVQSTRNLGVFIEKFPVLGHSVLIECFDSCTLEIFMKTYRAQEEGIHKLQSQYHQGMNLRPPRHDEPPLDAVEKKVKLYFNTTLNISLFIE